MSNWRLIEAELERAMDSLGFDTYTQRGNGDKFAGGCRCGEADKLNVSDLAKALSDRLSPIARPVQVKASAECEVQS